MTWHHLPKSASPYVQAAADLTWVLNLHRRALPQPAMLSGTNTLEKSLSPLKSKGDSAQPPSGGTSKPSQAVRGAGSLTPSSPDTHASRFPTRVNAKARTIHVTYGLTLPASSEKRGPLGLSSKMSLDTSASAQKPFSGSYEAWISMFRLGCSRRLKLARRTKGSGGSVWPTATATHNNYQVKGEFPNQTGGTTLTGAAEKLWGTPNGARMNYDENPDQYASRQARAKGNPPMGANLGQQAQAWPSPQERDYRMGSPMDGARMKRKAEQGWSENLNDTAESWPTPAQRDYKGARGEGMRSRHYRSISQLPDAAELDFSHPDPPKVTHGPMLSTERRIARQLLRSAMSSVSPATKRRWLRKGNWRKRRLNVEFCGWLMGWPEGHALLNCSGMEWSRWKLDMQSELYLMPTASGAWMWEPIDVPEETQIEMF